MFLFIYFSFFINFFFYETLRITARIQNSIANEKYPNYKSPNKQNDKEANIKV